MVASKKTSGKSRQPISREKVLKVAMRLADRQGTASLSMRKIAQAIGVEAMSLYNHVANKDDLLDGLLDAVVGEFEQPGTEGDWRSAIRASAISAHQVLCKHPWAAEMMLSRIRVGPASLAWADSTIGCLQRAGFSYPMADHAWNAIENHIYGFTLQAINSPVQPEAYAEAAAQYLPMIPADKYPHLNAMATLVASGEHTGVNDFEFGLELQLDGLRRLLG
ncbi:MAG: TetR/AcrR family transcriptional regulator [Granulosicoccaceae bacterium]